MRNAAWDVRSRRVAGRVCLGWAVAALVGLVAVQPAMAQAGPPDPILPFGVAAIALGQTARVNVAQITDPGIFPAGTTCKVRIHFFAADGTELVPAVDKDLAVGTAAFVDLSRATLTSIRGNRVPFRALVRFIGDPGLTPDPSCASVAATVEVYDNFTGRTSIILDPSPHLAPAAQ